MPSSSKFRTPEAKAYSFFRALQCLGVKCTVSCNKKQHCYWHLHPFVHRSKVALCLVFWDYLTQAHKLGNSLILLCMCKEYYISFVIETSGKCKLRFRSDCMNSSVYPNALKFQALLMKQKKGDMQNSTFKRKSSCSRHKYHKDCGCGQRNPVNRHKNQAPHSHGLKEVDVQQFAQCSKAPLDMQKPRLPTG